ncbi:MAG: hypothetical protein K2X01_11480 [Cyanobacteria bacterium]|nr:hypothetical protein [Cyanobacteriota bacterium]
MPISRRTTYTANTIIDADIHNLEHDDYVAAINQNTTDIAGCVKLTGDQVIAGNKGFSSIPYTTGGDPSTDNSLSRKAYVDSKAALLQGFLKCAPPIYLTAGTFSVASFNVRNIVNDGNITKLTSTTVDISTAGLNGRAQSANLSGTVAYTSGTNTVTGTGTSFLADFKIGDVIFIGGSSAVRITAVSSNTSLTVDFTWGSSASAQTYTRGGRAANIWYNLYAVTDGTTTGLLLSTRNVAGGDTLVDLPFTPSSALTGTVATTVGSATITGMGTTFQTDYQVGDTILINGGNQLQIASITSNTVMTATANASATVSAVTHTRIRARIRQIPFAVRNDGSAAFLPFFVTPGQGFWDIWYKDYEFGGYYVTLSGGTSTAGFTSPGGGVNVSCNAVIPPISKLGFFHFIFENNAGGGSFFHWVKNPESNTTIGTIVGLTPPTGPGTQYSQYPHSVDANQQIAYRVSSGGRFGMGVLGFRVTEVN